MPGPSVPSVSATAVPPDAVVVDVREPAEWDAGHIDGSLHVPLAQLTAKVDELPDAELLVVCRSGHRSARAVAWLVQTGRDAVNLEGGLQAWHAAGRDLVTETGNAPTVR